MLARVREFDAEIDIDIGIEPKLPKLKFDQELKDCVEEPRRVSRRVRRRESLRESRRMWLRGHVCLSRVASRVVSSTASNAYSNVSTRRARMLGHGSGESV